MDWAMDEQPMWLKTRAGPLLAVPYARPTNDITALHGAKVAPALWGDMLIDQFECCARASRNRWCSTSRCIPF